jgi:hypothetical protein
MSSSFSVNKHIKRQNSPRNMPLEAQVRVGVEVQLYRRLFSALDGNWAVIATSRPLSPRGNDLLLLHRRLRGVRDKSGGAWNI